MRLLLTNNQEDTSQIEVIDSCGNSLATVKIDLWQKEMEVTVSTEETEKTLKVSL